MGLVVARIDPELIIWGIVVLFWVIAQVLAKVKEFGQGQQQERKAPAGPKDPSGQPSVQDELKDFLETLTGYAPEEEEEPEAWHPKPAEKPKPIIQFDPPPVMQEPAPAPAPDHAYSSSEAKIPDEFEFVDIKEIKEIKETMHLTHQSAVTGRTLIQMQTVNIQTVPMPVFRTNSHDHPTKPPRFKNRKAFRDAVMAHEVLGPCQAMKKPEIHE